MDLLILVTCLLLSGLDGIVFGQYASKVPAVVPLIHQSHYLNAWMAGEVNDTARTVSGIWPQAYTGTYISWIVFARIDGTVYPLQGGYPRLDVNHAIKPVGTLITPTRSICTMEAGPVQVNLTFLTIYDNWVYQSLPLAYLAVNLSSIDGQTHSVQLYSDVFGLLSISAPGSDSWNTTTTSTSVYHEAPANVKSFSPDAESATQYFGVGQVTGVKATWQTGDFEECRSNFSTSGKLLNTSATVQNAVAMNHYNAMAFALDFGNITTNSQPVVFAVGTVRDTAIATYAKGSNPPADIFPLWLARWSNTGDALTSSLLNFPSVLSLADSIDSKIIADTNAIVSKYGMASVGSNFTDLIILNFRQTIGSLEFTTTRRDSENLDDVRVFMVDPKSRRVSPVEVLYSAYPMFLYSNTTLAGKLLEPLLESQAATTYKQEYAAPDLGIWPNITLDQDSSYYTYGIEHCGSMLIMVLAYTQKTGDKKLISTYYDLLTRWADFLVKHSVQPADFRTADGLSSATSNLILKGINAIYAMAKINKLLETESISGASSDQTLYYLEKSNRYAQQWQDQACLSGSSDHVISAYGNRSSWGLLYNLYSLRLIGSDIISEKVYDLQASWYANRASSEELQFSKFGLPYDSYDPSTFKTHWTLLTAASVFNGSHGRDALINMAHSTSFVDVENPNPSTYISNSSGTTVIGAASPAMGAAFAFHALNVPDILTAQVPVSSPLWMDLNVKKPNIKDFVVVIVVFVLLVLLICYLQKRHNNRFVADTWQVPGEPQFVTPFHHDEFNPFSMESSMVLRPLGPRNRVSGQPRYRKPRPSSSNQVAAQENPIGQKENTSSSNMITDVAQAGRDQGTSNLASGSSRNLETQEIVYVDHLRWEVEQLRRENEELREHQWLGPPPVYSDPSATGR